MEGTHELEELVALRPAPRLDPRRIHRQVPRARGVVYEVCTAAEPWLLARTFGVRHRRPRDGRGPQQVLFIASGDAHETDHVLGELRADMRLRVVRGDRAEDLYNAHERSESVREETVLTSSMKTLSALSGRPANSGFCVDPPSFVGTRTASSSLPIEPSAFTVPVRMMSGFELDHDAGWFRCMSFDTTMRFVPMSHSRSHEPAVSKIGFVTPAMYPGLHLCASVLQNYGKNVCLTCSPTPRG